MDRSRAVERNCLLVVVMAVLLVVAGCDAGPTGSQAAPTSEVSSPAASEPSTTQPSPATEPTPSTSPTPSKSPSAKPPPTAAPAHVIRAGSHKETAWSSPSGNILCAAYVSGSDKPRVRCEIFNHDWKTDQPRPRSCDAEFWGSGIALSDTAKFACAEDPPGIPDPGSASTWWWHKGDPTAEGFDGRWAALKRNTELVIRPGFSCTSRSTGMTCRNDRSGHGFTIAEKDYQIW